MLRGDILYRVKNYKNKILWALVIFNTVGVIILLFLVSLVFIAAFLMPNGSDETKKYIDDQMKINREYIDKVVTDDQKYINQETQKLYNYLNSR